MTVKVTINGVALTGGQKLALHAAVLQYMKDLSGDLGAKLGPTINGLYVARLTELNALLYGRALPDTCLHEWVADAETGEPWDICWACHSRRPAREEP